MNLNTHLVQPITSTLRWMPHPHLPIPIHPTGVAGIEASNPDRILQVLKRQRAHMEAAKVLSFTEERREIFWLVVWNIFSDILGIIIPIDFHILQRGVKPPTSFDLGWSWDIHML